MIQDHAFAGLPLKKYYIKSLKYHFKLPVRLFRRQYTHFYRLRIAKKYFESYNTHRNPKKSFINWGKHAHLIPFFAEMKSLN